MNDQLFQQLLDSITQMTDIIKKQQETIDKLTTKDVQYVHIEKISTEEFNKRLNEAPIIPYKTTGVNEQKDVTMSFGYQPKGTLGNPPKDE